MTEEFVPLLTGIAPPFDEEERRDWLQLIRSWRVGPATFYRLLGDYGSAAAALAALPEVARAAGVEDYRPCPLEVARAEIRAGRIAGARLIAMGEADYPPLLATLTDPPPLIWALGDAGLLARPAVALVGTRQASSLGARMARQLAQDLGASGQVVVSGLARGIDTAAHLGGLATGTIAVLPGGVDVVYPTENVVLAQEIADRGLRISDQPMGMVPQARHFVRRNRLIAGLGRAVVVVEAAARSGSLITAREALDAGREVMAVPGHPMDSRASGCNLLLRDGALLVRSAGDVLAALAAPDAETEARGEARAPEPGPSQPVRFSPGPRSSRPAQEAGETGKGVPCPAGKEPAVGGGLERAPSQTHAECGPSPPVRRHAGAARRPAEPEHIQSDARRPQIIRRSGLPAQEALPLTEGAPATAPPDGSRIHCLPQAPQTRSLRETAALHGLILARLSVSPIAEDQLIRDLGLGAGLVGQGLVALELDGQIERRPGGYLSRLN